MRSFASCPSLPHCLYGILVLVLFVRPSHALTIGSSLSTKPLRLPRGSAANALQKKKVAILGTGGYLGSLTFGFLQRASSLFGTGIGNVRSIGATADTAVRMNRVLSKNFCLAVADESYIKLTDLQSIEAIEKRLDGWDALILGNDLHLNYRPVTANTYETTPNDKTHEIYWDAPRGMDLPFDSANPVKDTILQNVITAAQRAGVQHIVAVDNSESSRRLQPLLETSSVPYTVLLHGPTIDTRDYTYRKGIQGRVAIATGANYDSESGTGSSRPVSSTNTLAREDLAALCVQSLLSLDWTKSRCIQVVSGADPAIGTTLNAANAKRPDQEWCVNSYLLEEVLQGIE